MFILTIKKSTINKMDLNSILDRFSGKRFVVYGGDDNVVKQIQEKGEILIWYTTRYNESSSPPQQLFSRFVQNMDDALRNVESVSPIRDSMIIIIGNGYANGMKAEVLARHIISSRGYMSKVLIFHGYPGFVTMTDNRDIIGGVVKQVYAGGCIVAREDHRISYLQELTNVMLPSVSIPVPLQDQDLSVDSQFTRQIQGLLPFIHMISRIRQVKESTGSIIAPISTGFPTDIIDINNVDRQREYDSNEWTSAMHWGQRKLLISEIELIVEVLRDDILKGGNGRGFTIVYVGAAPGSHIPYLLSLFANVTDLRIHVWDRPSRFDIKEDTSIDVDRRIIRIVPPEFADPSMNGEYEGFFTDDVAQKYLQRYGLNNKLIFISDIRDRSSEEAVDRDMTMQKRWVETMQPYASQLKFRLPFGIGTTYEYLSGQIYTQAWSRIKSTETRLLSFRPFSMQTYNISSYEKALSYFNVITRMSSYDIGAAVDQAVRRYAIGTTPNTSGIGPVISIPDEGYCTCHDCTREAQVMAKYMAHVGIPPSKDVMIRFIRLNTTASRPRDDRTNKRTLWSRVMPKATPSDRRSMVLFRTLPDNHEQMEKDTNTLLRQYLRDAGRTDSDILFSDTTIDKLRVVQVSKILIYGDGLSVNEIVDTLMAKRDNQPYIISNGTPITIMRNVISGERPNMVVNFHTDFINGYSPERDKGIVGTAQYNTFMQGLAIRNQGKASPHIDIQGQLLLFAISCTI